MYLASRSPACYFEKKKKKINKHTKLGIIAPISRESATNWYSTLILSEFIVLDEGEKKDKLAQII